MKDRNFIPFPGNGQSNKLAEASRQFKQDIPFMIEHVAMMAKLHREKYNSLIREGFTEAQALELCKVIP